MAIGTLTAIGLGVGALGAGASAISSNNASKRAAQTATNTSAANNALARDIYGQNQQALSPFMQRGNAAGDQINALLGLGGAANNNMATPQPTATQPAYAGGYTGSGYAGSGGGFGNYGSSMYPAQFSTGIPQANAPFQFWSGQQPPQGVASNAANNPPQANPQQAANNAFDNFRNSTGYQFRRDQGQDALNSGYAGAGILQSGDAMRAATEYGQNFASNEFGNYMGLLANQQGVGLSGASALAGVGQNYANNVTANNNAASSAIANAQLAKQNPLGNMAGMIGGGLFQYGLGG